MGEKRGTEKTRREGVLQCYVRRQTFGVVSKGRSNFHCIALPSFVWSDGRTSLSNPLMDACALTGRFAKTLVAALLPILKTSLFEVDRIKDSMFSWSNTEGEREREREREADPELARFVPGIGGEATFKPPEKIMCGKPNSMREGGGGGGGGVETGESEEGSKAQREKSFTRDVVGKRRSTEKRERCDGQRRRVYYCWY